MICIRMFLFIIDGAYDFVKIVFFLLNSTSFITLIWQITCSRAHIKLGNTVFVYSFVHLIVWVSRFRLRARHMSHKCGFFILRLWHEFKFQCQSGFRYTDMDNLLESSYWVFEIFSDPDSEQQFFIAACRVARCNIFYIIEQIFQTNCYPIKSA